MDALELDEFNLSDEDFAALAASMVDDRKQTEPLPSSAVSMIRQPLSVPTSVSQQQSSSPSQTVQPPKPSPRTQKLQQPSQPSPAKPSSESSRPAGLIDLDAPEFAEFDMTDEELEALAASFVDDRGTSSEGAAKLEPPPPAPQQTTKSLPVKVQPSPTSVGGPPSKETVQAVLQERKDQYHKAALNAKQSGDTTGMKRYGTVAVQFDNIIKALSEGQPIDLSKMPPPPPGFKSSYNVDISKYSPPTPTASVTQSVQKTAEPEEEAPVNPEIPIPKTPLEALQQRLDKYKEGQKSAQDAGESSRVRRMGRIIKQYEGAIKTVKAGKPIDLSDLPCPPGYPPIPAGRPPAAAKPTPQPASAARPVAQSLPPSMPTQRKALPSLSDRQLQTLQERIAEFRQAARNAKAKNDKDNALKFLRYSKGVEQMLQAAQNGLPVDLTQVQHTHMHTHTHRSVGRCLELWGLIIIHEH